MGENIGQLLRAVFMARRLWSIQCQRIGVGQNGQIHQKTKRRTTANKRMSMNTNNSWMLTTWNMMNGMRLGIDAITPSGGSVIPFLSAEVYTSACKAVTPSGFRYFRNSTAIRSFSFFAASDSMLSSVGTGTGLLSKRLNVSTEQASRSPLMVV